MATTDDKPQPLVVLRSDALDTDLVQYLSRAYLVTVEAQENEIIYKLFEHPRNERSTIELH